MNPGRREADMNLMQPCQRALHPGGRRSLSLPSGVFFFYMRESILYFQYIFMPYKSQDGIFSSAVGKNDGLSLFCA